MAGMSDGQRQRSLDECGGCERLWVVAQVLPGCGIHFFGVEAQDRPAIQQLLEQLDGLSCASALSESLDQPEGAGQERALDAGETITSWGISVEQGAAGSQIPAYGIDRSADPRRTG